MRFNDSLNHYRFQSTWFVASDPGSAFDVLADLGTYVEWWPEVKAITRIDDDTAGVTIRAFLPYSLHLVMCKIVEDRVGGILKASLSGDLEGFSEFVLEEKQSGCLLHYRQEVVARKPLLRALAPVARPLFRINHLIMMRRGNRGLTRYLEKNR